MTQLGSVYQTETTNQTHTGDLTYNTKMTVLGSAFGGLTEYLMLVHAQVGGDNANGRFKFQVQIGGVTPEGAEMIVEPASITLEKRHPFVFLHKFTTLASPDDVTFQIAPQQSTGDIARADSITLLALNLDDLAATDWFYGEDLTDIDHTTVSTWQNQASITFTPGTTGQDWLIIAWGSVHINNAGKQWRYRIDFDAGTSLEPQLSQEGEDTAEEWPWMLVRPHNIDNTEHTFTVQSNDDSAAGSENQHNISKIFALRLQAFEDVITFWNGGTFDTPDTNFNEIADLAYTATTTGNGVAIGTALTVRTSAGTVANVRMQIGGVTEPTGKDGNWDVGGFDVDDLLSIPAFARYAITASSTADVDVDTQVDNAGLDIIDRGFAAFSLELAAAADTVVNVPLGTFTLAGLVPEVAAGAGIDTPLGTFTLAGLVPEVAAGAGIDTPLGTFTLTGLVPTILGGVGVFVPLGTFTLMGLVPEVAAGAGVDVPLGSFALAGQVPEVAAGAGIDVPLGTFTLAGQVPEVAAGAGIDVPLGTFALTGLIPTIIADAGAGEEDEMVFKRPSRS